MTLGAAAGPLLRAAHRRGLAVVQPSPPARARSAASMAASSARLAVVGDVHGQWDERDAAALRGLGAGGGIDLALLVGDFGNERVDIVREIAGLELPKAVVLGNHDAWYTMGRKRSPSPSPAAPGAEQQPAADRVQEQLDALGACHIGYGHAPVSGKRVSVVGARPFTKGGKSLSSIQGFVRRYCGVESMAESAQRIAAAAAGVPPGHALLVLGHNGPAGLGSERHHICGVDWRGSEAGDHGDPDLREALELLAAAGRPPAAVIFGHMHHSLKGGGLRQMVAVDEAAGTVFLNAATVPRVVTVPQEGPRAPACSRHHFLVVDVQAGQVQAAADVWVQVQQRQQQQPGEPTQQQQQQPEPPRLQRPGERGEPQQLLLEQRPLNVDARFTVQVAEVREVFRREAQRGGGGGSGGWPVEWFDAHAGAWRRASVGGGGGEAVAAAVAAGAMGQAAVAN